MAELERRVGRSLFERQGRRRVLASGTEPVLDYARRVISETRDLRRWLDATEAGVEGRLRLGMIDAAAVGHFSEALAHFANDRPDVELHLTVAPSGPLLAKLLANEIDVAVIVRPPVNPAGVDIVELLHEPLAVYRPAGDDHRGGPESWGPWVAFPEGSHTRTLVTEHLASVGVDYSVVAESHQPDVLRAMVRLGLGWTVLPVIQAETGVDPLPRATAQPLFHRTLVAARRSGALPHPIADAVVSWFAAVARPET